MKDHRSRREFLKQTLCTSATVAGLGMTTPATLFGVEPFERSGAARLRLSLAAYSFREAFQGGLDLFGFIDFCAKHGCDGTELTSYYFDDVSPEFLLKIRRHAFLKGIDISGTAVGNNFVLPEGEERQEQIAMVKEWVDHAHLMGAPHIRIFVGSSDGLDQATAKRRSLPAIEECGEYAGKKGIFLGLENHGRYAGSAEDLLDIVRDVRSPWVGVNLDTGNFHTSDPYTDIAQAAPYAVNVQLKVRVDPEGGESRPTDLRRVVRILREAGYQGYVALEYEEEDPREAIPGWLDRMIEVFRGAGSSA